MPHPTTSKGDIGVARATADLIEKGFDVLAPVCATSPFDLVIYRDGRFARIQVKYRMATNGVLTAGAFRHTIKRGVVAKRANDEVDILCIFSPETGKCYYFNRPIGTVHLRLAEPKNGQRALICYARDYETVPF